MLLHAGRSRQEKTLLLWGKDFAVRCVMQVISQTAEFGVCFQHGFH
jgi:hypothetical protein